MTAPQDRNDFRERWVFLRLVIVAATLLLALIPPGAAGDWRPQVAWLVFVLSAYAALPRHDRNRGNKGTAAACLVAVLLMVVQIFTASGRGDALFVVPLPLDREIAMSTHGLQSGIVLAAKVLSMFISARLLGAASIGAVAAALSRLYVPGLVSDGLLLGQRALVVVEAQWNSVLDAHRLRGFDVDSQNMLKRILRSYPAMIVPLMISLMRRNLQLEISLVMRRFYEPVRKTYLYEPTVRIAEWAAIGAAGVLWIFLMSWNVGIGPWSG